MKLNKIALALAALMAAPAAFAHSPTTIPDLVVRISGASAQQGTLVQISEQMMVAGTIDVFYNDAAGKNHRAVFGTVKPTGTAIGVLGTTIPASIGGKKVLITDRAAGGSFYGVGPVARAQAIDAMKVDGSCTSTGNAFPSASYYCAGTELKISDAGVSDVEPGMFRGDNLPAGETALSAAESAILDVASQNGVVMGIAVTSNLPLTSLSKAAIQSIMTGTYTDWSQVDAGLSGPITLETRAAGSGTKAAANAFFLNNPCSSAGLPPFGTQGDPVNFSTYTVVENGSTGGVKAGLNSVFGKGMMGLGLVSLENTPAVTDNWKFIAIDGVAPTIANAVNGDYQFFVEQSMQWRTSTNGTAVGDVLNTFRTVSSDPLILSALPGVAATPFNYDAAYAATTLKGTRAAISGPNSCQPVQLYY
ncbi:MAG: substrate-binding domain-containing protein [Thiobacillus sp.]